MRLASVPFLCTCIACVYPAGCKDENTTPAAVRAARVVVVTPHQLGVVAEGAGLIQSRYDSPVGFEVGGRLVARYVDIGAVVTKGQKLAKLSDIDYRNRVTAAEGGLATAKAAVAQAAPQEERYRILLKQGWTTRALYESALKDLQSAQAQVQSADANFRIAQNQLGYTELLAPDGGEGRPGPGRGGRPSDCRDRPECRTRSRFRRRQRTYRTCKSGHARQGLASGTTGDRGYRLDPRNLARGRQHYRHVPGEGDAVFAAAGDALGRRRGRSRRNRRPGGHEPSPDRPAAVGRRAAGLGRGRGR